MCGSFCWMLRSKEHVCIILKELFIQHWPALLQVAGRYRVMVESSMASTDDIIFNCGDVIELLHEDSLGMW